MDTNETPEPIRDDSTGFPCWLRRGGDPNGEGLLCGSKEVEDDWAKKGYVRAGHALPDTYKLPVPDAPADHVFSAMNDPSPKPAPDQPTNEDPPVMKVNQETKAAEGVESESQAHAEGRL